MSIETQQRFLTSFLSTMFRRARVLVDNGTLPSDWDGHELRQFLADEFARETTGAMSNKRGERRRAYEYVMANMPTVPLADMGEELGHRVVTTFGTEFEAQAFAAAHGGVYRGLGWNE